MNKTTEALKLAEEALDLAQGSHGVMLMSNPPHDAWVYRGVERRISKALAAIRLALAEPDDLDWITPEAVFEAKLKAHGIPNPTAEPVKQEPFCYLRQTSSEQNPPHGWAVHFGSGEVSLYREPVDTKAIRAEALIEAKEHFSKQLVGFRASVREQALEEAAKMAEAYVARGIGMEMATAIRGLK